MTINQKVRKSAALSIMAAVAGSAVAVLLFALAAGNGPSLHQANADNSSINQPSTTTTAAYANAITSAATNDDKNGNDRVSRTISLTGRSTVQVMPDRVAVSFSVENQEKTARDAIRVNAGMIDAAIQSLKEAGVDESEISTAYFNVYPVYEYREEPVECYYRDVVVQDGSETPGQKQELYCPPPVGRQILVGYKAVNSIIVESEDIDGAGIWIDAAVGAGANRVDYVYFVVSAAKQDEIRSKLTGEAIRDARSKAELAIAPLGMRITNVASINLDAYPVIYPRKGYEYGQGSPSPTTPIIPGSQEVSATAHVTFEIGGFEVVRETPFGTSSSMQEASASETFTITLDSNPTTGYTWEVTAITNDQVVKFLKSEYTPSESELVGGGGKQVLTF